MKRIVKVVWMAMCVVAMAFGPLFARGRMNTARAQSVDDIFYANGQKYGILIGLSQVGVLAYEDVTAQQVAAFADQQGLSLARQIEGGLFILGLPQPRDRAGIVDLARELRRVGDKIVAQAGLVAQLPQSEAPLVISDHFVAQFGDNVSQADIDKLNADNAVQIVMENPFVHNQFLLAATPGSPGDALTLANRYQEHALVSFGHPDFIRQIDLRETIPSDTLFANQWTHRNTGASGGTVDADADTSWAWDITRGSASTVIAIIDDGLEITHPDLSPNAWVNPGETAGDGLDNDGNGFIDDINGWDFSACATTPGPGCGDNNTTAGRHGTSVAGVAAARGDNSLGVTGACTTCRLMAVRASLTNVASSFVEGLALDYARTKGAAVINNSWGYPIGTPATTNVVNAANNAATLGRGGLGSVVIFAMNNPAVNDCIGATPDISSLPNVIGVSRATNQDRFNSGGFGNCMDLLAPTHGGTLWVPTTDRTTTTGYNNTNPIGGCPSVEPAPPPANARDYTLCFNGTSAAAPLVAGISGLVLTANSGLTRLQVQRMLQDTADKIQDSTGRYATNTGFSTPATGQATHGFGRVNAFEAVRVAAPGAVGGRAGVDIFLRDNRLDWGNTTGYQGQQPSNTLFEPVRGVIGHWESVDIKIDAAPFGVAPTTSAAFDAFADEAPEAGEVNRVYVRVHNRGPVAAASVTVKLHWVQFGTALPPLPADFWTAFPADSADTSQIHPLGAQTIINLGYSGASVAGGAGDGSQIVQFNFPAPEISPSLPNHYCLFAVIDSPQDRVDPLSRARLVIDDITPNDNNVTHRNVQLVNTRSVREFNRAFYMRNPLPKTAHIVLTLANPDILEQGWEIIPEGFVFGQPMTMEAGKEVLVGLKVVAPGAGQRGEVRIVQTEFNPQQEPGQATLIMGGLNLQFEPTYWAYVPVVAR